MINKKQFKQWWDEDAYIDWFSGSRFSFITERYYELFYFMGMRSKIEKWENDF